MKKLTQVRYRDATAGVTAVFLLLLANWYLQSLLVPFGDTERVISLLCLATASLLIAAWVAAQERRNLLPWARENGWLLLLFLYVALNALLVKSAGEEIRWSARTLLLLFSAVIIFGLARIPRSQIDLARRAVLCFAILYAMVVTCSLEPVTGPLVYRLDFAMTGQMNPNTIAISFIPITVCAAHAMATAGNRNGLLLASLALAACGFVLGLSYSHSVLTGAFLANCIYLAGLSRPRAAGQFLLFPLAVLTGILIVRLLSDDSAIREIYLEDRFRIWRRYWDRAMEAPVFGHGFSQHLNVLVMLVRGDLKEFTHAHNVPLHVFAQGGIVGLLLFTLMGIELTRNVICTALQGIRFPLALLVAVIPAMLLTRGDLLVADPGYLVLAFAPVFASLACARMSACRADRERPQADRGR